MENSNSFDGIPAPARTSDTTVSLAGTAGILSPDKRGINLRERIFYHGFVGAFLTLIAVVWVFLSNNLVTLPHHEAVFLAAWTALAVSYTHWRVKTEIVRKSKNNLQNHGDAFSFEVLNDFLPGAALGLLVAMAVGSHLWFFVVGGGLLNVAFQAWGRRYVEKSNAQTIERWVAEAGEEGERARRLAYVQSGALLIGAAAAGVAEYEGAPQLLRASSVWGTSFSSDEDDDWTYINPATGLPTVGNMPGGVDVGGNSWGSSGHD